MQVTYVDHMGDDLRVVNAARVSFLKESNWVEDICDCSPMEDLSTCACTEVLNEKDSKLIKYLADHNHWTPFSHPQITLREKVPIFVARQRFKHMVGFTYNEVSRRYVDDVPEFYTPDFWRCKPEGSIKQGSSLEAIASTDIWTEAYKTWMHDLVDFYNDMISSGVAPEQARMVLPQSMYTEYYTTGSLAAFARAYRQRSETTAQIEIQELAKEWQKIIEPLFPVSWSALVEP